MKKLHYAWVVLGCTFIVLLVSAAIRATPGVLIVPLEHEFGWSRTTISFAISINLVLYGLIGPFAAGLVNRYGPRRVVTLAALVLGAGTLATLWITQSWQLVAFWGIVVGSGTGVLALVLGTAIVQRWFSLHRGLALGLLTASSATGQLIFLPALAKITVTSGWRSSVLVVAAAAFLLAPLAYLLLRDRPEEKGLAPLGSADSASPPAPIPGATGNPFLAPLAALRMASRHPMFWVLAGSFFVCGASTNGLIGTHLIPACMDHGIPEVQAAGLLAVMGIFDMVGTTGSGWLSDRFDNRVLLFTYYGLRGLSLLYLPYAFVSDGLAHGSSGLAVGSPGHGLSLFAVFYGLDWIATVPPTVALARQAFGAENASLIFGWVVAAHQLGAALATSVAGFIRTIEGSYDHAFMISGGLCMIAAVGVLFAGKRTRGAALSPLPG